MRVARDFVVGGVRPYHAPERPRVADPARRRRIAAYLEGGTPVRHGQRTDGLWLWPEHFVADIMQRGLAPEPDFLHYMQSVAFRPNAPALDDRLRDDAQAAMRAGPPRPPQLAITYFVRVDEESSPQAPLSLLRRVVEPGGRTIEEGMWRDLAWHPTHTLAVHLGEYDLREVSAEHAALVIDRWCAKWHAELIARHRVPQPG